jgi:hypothetical protein
LKLVRVVVSTFFYLFRVFVCSTGLVDMSVEQVSKVASVLASYVTEATVSSAIARYGDVGEHLLAFAVALEIGLPACTTLQVAQLANKNKEVNELRSVIRRQEARLREYASTDFSHAPSNPLVRPD